MTFNQEAHDQQKLAEARFYVANYIKTQELLNRALQTPELEHLFLQCEGKRVVGLLNKTPKTPELYVEVDGELSEFHLSVTKDSSAYTYYTLNIALRLKEKVPLGDREWHTMPHNGVLKLELTLKKGSVVDLELFRIDRRNYLERQSKLLAKLPEELKAFEALFTEAIALREADKAYEAKRAALTSHRLRTLLKEVH